MKAVNLLYFIEQELNKQISACYVQSFIKQSKKTINQIF